MIPSEKIDLNNNDANIPAKAEENAADILQNFIATINELTEEWEKARQIKSDEKQTAEAKEQAEKDEEKIVEALKEKAQEPRKKLKLILCDAILANDKPLIDETYAALITLAELAPLNLIDGISYCEIDPKHMVYVSTGQRFDILTLLQYHETRHYREEEKDSDAKFLYDYSNNEMFSPLDVIQIQKKGITISNLKQLSESESSIYALLKCIDLTVSSQDVQPLKNFINTYPELIFELIKIYRAQGKKISSKIEHLQTLIPYASALKELLKSNIDLVKVLDLPIEQQERTFNNALALKKLRKANIDISQILSLSVEHQETIIKYPEAFIFLMHAKISIGELMQFTDEQRELIFKHYSQYVILINIGMSSSELFKLDPKIQLLALRYSYELSILHTDGMELSEVLQLSIEPIKNSEIPDFDPEQNVTDETKTSVLEQTLSHTTGIDPLWYIFPSVVLADDATQMSKQERFRQAFSIFSKLTQQQQLEFIKNRSRFNTWLNGPSVFGVPNSRIQLSLKEIFQLEPISWRKNVLTHPTSITKLIYTFGVGQSGLLSALDKLKTLTQPQLDAFYKHYEVILNTLKKFNISYEKLNRFTPDELTDMNSEAAQKKIEALLNEAPTVPEAISSTEIQEITNENNNTTKEPDVESAVSYTPTTSSFFQPAPVVPAIKFSELMDFIIYNSVAIYFDNLPAEIQKIIQENNLNKNEIEFLNNLSQFDLTKFNTPENVAEFVRIFESVSKDISVSSYLSCETLLNFALSKGCENFYTALSNCKINSEATAFVKLYPICKQHSSIAGGLINYLNSQESKHTDLVPKLRKVIEDSIKALKENENIIHILARKICSGIRFKTSEFPDEIRIVSDFLKILSLKSYYVNPQLYGKTSVSSESNLDNNKMPS